MTLLRERGRSDDNDARAFLLSNTAEERVEALDRFSLPEKDLSSWAGLMNRTESKTRPYWHIHIGDDFQLIKKPGSPTVNLRRYLITYLVYMR